MRYRQPSKIIIDIAHQVSVWSTRVTFFSRPIDIGINRIEARIQCGLAGCRQLLQIKTNVATILIGSPLSRELHNPDIDLFGQPTQCITNGPHLGLSLLNTPRPLLTLPRPVRSVVQHEDDIRQGGIRLPADKDIDILCLAHSGQGQE
ncbi:hypothetical protein D3C78_829250 [compost metagenome]